MIYGSADSWFCPAGNSESPSFQFDVLLLLWKLEYSLRSLGVAFEVGHVVVADSWSWLYWAPAPTFLAAECSKFDWRPLYLLSVCHILMRSGHHKFTKRCLFESPFVAYGGPRAPASRIKRWLGNAVVAYSWVTQVVGLVEKHRWVTISARASGRAAKEVPDGNGVLVKAFTSSNSSIFTIWNIATRFSSSVRQWLGERVLWLVTNRCLSHWLANDPIDFVVRWPSWTRCLGLIHVRQRQTLCISHLEITWQHARVPLLLPWPVVLSILVFILSVWICGLVAFEPACEGLSLLWPLFYQSRVCLASVWCSWHLVVTLIWILCILLEDLAVLNDVVDLEYFILWLAIVGVWFVNELLQIAGGLAEWPAVSFSNVRVEICWNEFIGVSAFVHWDVCLGQILEVPVLWESARVCAL